MLMENDNSDVNDYSDKFPIRGAICRLSDVEGKNNPIVIGKVVRILPLIKKSKFQPHSVLVSYFEEPSHDADSNHEYFKAVFVGKFAENLSSLSLCRKDSIAFCQVPLLLDSTYPSDEIYHKQFIVELSPQYQMKNLFYQKRNMADWISLEHVSSKNNERTGNCILNHFNSKLNALASNANNIKIKALNNAVVTDKSKKLDVANLYQYTKLANIRENMKVNVFAVVTRIVTKPTITSTGRYHSVINIIDESKTDGFFIHIYWKTKELSPTLQPYCIIRLHRVKIEVHDEKLDGRIFHSHDIITFLKENTNTIYRQSKNYTITDKDIKRIKELKTWLFENIQASRPFMKLNLLQRKQQTINLHCEIVRLKQFKSENDSQEENDNVLVLRVRDGSTCTVPFYRLPLQYDYWVKVISEAKCNYLPSDEIDIIVTDLDAKFKKLSVGDEVELFNVKTIICKEINKSKEELYIKACLVGKWDNLKVTRSSKNNNKELDDLSKDNASHVIQRKRKLFNPSIINSDDEENQKSNDFTKEKEDDHNPARISTRKRKFINLNIMSSDDEENEQEFNNENKRAKSPSSRGPRAPSTTILDESTASVRHTSASTSPIREINARSSPVRQTNASSSQPIVSPLPNRLDNELVPRHNTNFQNTSDEVNLYEKNLNTELLKKLSFQCLTKWPACSTSDGFHIRAFLLNTIPVINTYSSDLDVMSLVNAYCVKCECYFSYTESKWVHCEDEGPIAVCPNCKKGGVHVKELITNKEARIKFKKLAMIKIEKQEYVFKIIPSESNKLEIKDIK